MSGPPLITVKHVKKAFCRSLRRSLAYGVRDILADLAGQRSRNGRLRAGEFYAVNDVSFDLQPGESLGIIGRNGAGKTTLLKMLTGLIKPDAGEIRVRGRVGGLIALGAGFNPLLSGRENIYVNGAVLGMSKAAIDAKLASIIAFADIGPFIDAPVQSYSSGMVVRLGFAVAVHSAPNSILLDEVLAVGDTAFQAKCLNTLSQLRSQGIGFILVSHNMSVIEYFCDRVLYLKHGQCAYLGATQPGLAAYHRDLLEAPDDSPSDSQNVSGNGKVVMRRIRFVDATGKESSVIYAGEPVTLRIDYECADAAPTPTIVDVHIKDQGGTFFHAPRAVEFKTLKGRGRIEVRFESMPANNQKLLFSIALLDSHSRAMFDWKCDIPLIVQGRMDVQGRVALAFHPTLVEDADGVGAGGFGGPRR